MRRWSWERPGAAWRRPRPRWPTRAGASSRCQRGLRRRRRVRSPAALQLHSCALTGASWWGSCFRRTRSFDSAWRRQRRALGWPGAARLRAALVPAYSCRQLLVPAVPWVLILRLHSTSPSSRAQEQCSSLGRDLEVELLLKAETEQAAAAGGRSAAPGCTVHAADGYAIGAAAGQASDASRPRAAAADGDREAGSPGGQQRRRRGTASEPADSVVSPAACLR